MYSQARRTVVGPTLRACASSCARRSWSALRRRPERTAWTRGAVMIGWRNSDPGSNRVLARVETSWFQSPALRRVRSSFERERDRPGDVSMEQLFELVLERSSFDLDRKHLAGGAPAREAGRPVGAEDHPRLRRGDDLLRPAIRARVSGADEVDLVRVQGGLGVDTNFGVVYEPAERDRTERRGVEAHRKGAMVAQDREAMLMVDAGGYRARFGRIAAAETDLVSTPAVVRRTFSATHTVDSMLGVDRRLSRLRSLRS